GRRLGAGDDLPRSGRLSAAAQHDRYLLAGMAVHVALQVSRPGDLLPVDRPDDVARLDPGRGGRRARCDLFHAHDAGRGLGADRKGGRQHHDRENEVHRDSRGEDDGLGPPRLRGERARVTGALLLDREVVLTEDPDKTAEGDRVDAVIDPTAPDRDDARWEPEGELEHAHAQQARRDVVTELVDRDDQGEHHEEERDREWVLREELDEPAHQATTAGAASEARTEASMEMISSRSGSRDRFARAPSSAPRRSSCAMSVKGISPRRKRSTATSSAADRPIIAPRSADRAVSRTTPKDGYRCASILPK